jgi:ubiquinone/menaquinone biosynthesis C-methylase UbiE
MDNLENPFPFMQSATAYAESKILLTAAKLGIFSRIPGRINPEVFARRYKLSEQGLHLLLNALVALRIMIREDDGSYKLLGEVAALFNRYPEIVADMLHHDHLYHVWERLEESIRTGESPAPPPEELASYPASLETFLLSMRAHATYLAPALCRLPEWEKKRNLLDLGGGGAGFARALTEAFKNLSVTIADLPDALAVTKRHLERNGETNRISLFPCNCYEDSLPEGPFDCILISHLVHIYPAPDNRRLIHKAAQRLHTGGDLFLLDYFLDENETAPKEAVRFRLLMKMGTPQGDCYSLPNALDWLKSAGLTSHQIISLQGGNTLITARR